MEVLQHKVDVQLVISDQKRTLDAVLSKRAAHDPAVKEDKRLEEGVKQTKKDKNKREDCRVLSSCKNIISFSLFILK